MRKKLYEPDTERESGYHQLEEEEEEEKEEEEEEEEEEEDEDHTFDCLPYCSPPPPYAHYRRRDYLALKKRW